MDLVSTTLLLMLEFSLLIDLNRGFGLYTYVSDLIYLACDWFTPWIFEAVLLFSNSLF